MGQLQEPQVGMGVRAEAGVVIGRICESWIQEMEDRCRAAGGLEEQEVENWKIRCKSAEQRVKLVMVAWKQREIGGQKRWIKASRGGSGIRDERTQLPDPPGF